MLRLLQSEHVRYRLPHTVQEHQNDFVRHPPQSIAEYIPLLLIVNHLVHGACEAQLVRVKVNLDKKGAKKPQMLRNHPPLGKEMSKLSLSKIQLKGKQGNQRIDNITKIIEVSSRKNCQGQERAVRP